MKKRSLTSGYIMACVLLLAACSGYRHRSGTLPPDVRQRYNYYYMEGERQRTLGNNDAAFALLTEASLTDTAAPAAQFALANYYLQLNKVDTAIYMLRKAAEGDTTQYWYNFSYARIASLANRNDEAIRVWSRLIRQNPDKPELNSALANAYIAQGNLKAALACYDSLENSMGLTESLTIEKMKLHEQSGDSAAMISDAERLQQAYPTNTSYMILLGDVYSSLNRDSDAWAMYDKVKLLEPDNGYLYLSRAAYYEQKGDSTAFHREMKAALDNRNIDMETKLGIFREYIAALVARKINLEELEPLYTSITEQYPQEAMVRQLYGFYLLVIKDYPRAREQYAIAADLAPMEAETWQHLLSIYLIDENFPAAVEEGKRALEYIPDNPEIYEIIGTALVQQKKYEEAAENILTAIDRCKNISPQQQSSLYGQLGDIYHELGRKEESYEQYEKALSINATNIYVLNNYSYFLALEEKDLSKAERMSALTVKERPDEPTYLDTYAWVLFKKGSYSLARIYIERAIEKSAAQPPGPEILEHYGDILSLLGETEAAVEQWTKARDAGSESKTLEQKIKQKEYIKQ